MWIWCALMAGVWSWIRHWCNVDILMSLFKVSTSPAHDDFFSLMSRHFQLLVLKGSPKGCRVYFFLGICIPLYQNRVVYNLKKDTVADCTALKSSWVQTIRHNLKQTLTTAETVLYSKNENNHHSLIIFVIKIIITCPSFRVIWPCSLQPMNVLLHLNTWSPARTWWAKAAGKKPILSSITPWKKNKFINQTWKHLAHGSAAQDIRGL